MFNISVPSESAVCFLWPTVLITHFCRSIDKVDLHSTSWNVSRNDDVKLMMTFIQTDFFSFLIGAATDMMRWKIFCNRSDKTVEIIIKYKITFTSDYFNHHVSYKYLLLTCFYFFRARESSKRSAQKLSKISSETRDQMAASSNRFVVIATLLLIKSLIIEFNFHLFTLCKLLIFYSFRRGNNFPTRNFFLSSGTWHSRRFRISWIMRNKDLANENHKIINFESCQNKVSWNSLQLLFARH